MSETVKILILAQTEPCVSEKYIETVCTAGITETLQWIRLYPIQKRMLSKEHEYSKYDWVQCVVDESGGSDDMRPESRKVDASTIAKIGELSTRQEWSERRQFLLGQNIPIVTTREALIQGALNYTFSLCLFKPKKVIRFYAEADSETYSEKQLARIREAQKQKWLFSHDGQIHPSQLNFFKVPYTFHCEFQDENDAVMKLSVLDWEIFTCYRKGIKHGKEESCRLTLERYDKYIESRDLYFVLGTRNEHHKWMANSKSIKINPWSIISVIPFPGKGEPWQSLFQF